MLSSKLQLVACICRRRSAGNDKEQIARLTIPPGCCHCKYLLQLSCGVTRITQESLTDYCICTCMLELKAASRHNLH